MASWSPDGKAGGQARPQGAPLQRRARVRERDALRAAGLREQVMIDVSHGNSSKQHQRQITVAHEVAAQIAAGERRIA